MVARVQQVPMVTGITAKTSAVLRRHTFHQTHTLAWNNKKFDFDERTHKDVTKKHNTRDFPTFSSFRWTQNQIPVQDKRLYILLCMFTIYKYKIYLSMGSGRLLFCVVCIFIVLWILDTMMKPS